MALDSLEEDRKEALKTALTAMQGDQYDLLLYSGPLEDISTEKLRHKILHKENKKEKCALFLTTYGGDADTAFRIAKTIRCCYKHFRLLIVGPCKSAGTLVAIGADELGFTPTGELGPLDVQMFKPDELILRNSGLDLLQALVIVSDFAFQSFEKYLLQISVRSQGSISTRTASEIATKIVTGLFSPITEQIDPMRLGEIQRAIDVAKAYGERLRTSNVKPETLDELVENYPSHSFVIDFDEASKLFNRVTHLNGWEALFFKTFYDFLKSPRPTSDPFTFDISELFDVIGGSDETPEGDGNPESVEENVTREPEASPIIENREEAVRD